MPGLFIAISFLLGVAWNVAMAQQKQNEYYGVVTIPVQIENREVVLLVDTGASATMLTQAVMGRLKNKRPLAAGEGIIASGEKTAVSVYVIPEMVIGTCVLKDVAVFAAPPAMPFGVLGMQALLKFPEFSFKRQKFNAMAPDGSGPCLPNAASRPLTN